MSSNTISPSIDQAAKLNFMDSFHELAQQSTSRLVKSGAISFAPSNGKTTNMARMGRIELAEVNTRNPDKQYGDYAVDNRQFSKRRLTRTITIDAKYDINELLKDPRSDIMNQLLYAKERSVDRIAVEAAVGNVLVGAPDEAPTLVSAVNDGVQTIDATAGFVYGTVEAVTQSFVNGDVPYSTFRGSVISVTGKEHTSIMGEDKFINNDYINGRPVEDGIMKELSRLYSLELFAGSVNGGAQVTMPILPEATTTRTCVVLAPSSILMSMEIGSMEVTKNPIKVNSFDITIDLWINAMRKEGALVKLITTTM